MDINSIIFQQADFGDYIFLILVVVGSIIQAFTQNQKKKALQKQAQEKNGQNEDDETEVMNRMPETMAGYDTPVGNIFDSSERTLIPEPEYGKYEWDDDFAQADEKENLALVSTENPENKAETVNADIAEKYPILFPQKTVTSNPAFSHKSRIREGFSLRKAVIYSEILNRKYT